MLVRDGTPCEGGVLSIRTVPLFQALSLEAMSDIITEQFQVSPFFVLPEPSVLTRVTVSLLTEIQPPENSFVPFHHW